MKFSIIPLFLLFTLTCFCSCTRSSGEESVSEVVVENQINGLHIFSRNEVEAKEFGIIRSINANSIVLVPYYYQKGLDSDTLFMSAKRGYEWTERDEGIINSIKKAKANNLDVIIKPHLWPFGIEGEGWRESVYPKASNWKSWSRCYTQATLHYARLAEEYDCRMFCIGTELKDLAVKKPEYWRELIREVRKEYSGELVYAANWYEEYEKITFWDELDYIGIQGYFPLSDNPNPTNEELMESWKIHKASIARTAQKFQKPVLFTELGYRCATNAASKPWEWDENWGGKNPKFVVSEPTQLKCYQAFFDSFSKEPWYAGVLIWNWRIPYDSYGGQGDQNFTPQRKLAEKEISKYFLGSN